MADGKAVRAPGAKPAVPRLLNDQGNTMLVVAALGITVSAVVHSVDEPTAGVAPAVVSTLTALILVVLVVALAVAYLGSSRRQGLRGKASTVWIVTWGSRGDHEPAAALALGLRRRGHRVRVFGSVQMRGMFRAHGLDFDALDNDVLAHPANVVAQDKLRDSALHTGFEGPNKAEDYLFDTWLQWIEFFNRKYVRLLAGGKGIQEALMDMMPDMDAAVKFQVLGQGLDALNDTRREQAAFLAKVHGQALEDYLPIARRARADFRAFLLRKAGGEFGCTAYQLLNLLTAGFRQHMKSVMQSGDAIGLVIERVNSFNSWYGILAKDEGGSLDEYWERWMSRLPPLEGVMTCGVDECGPRSIQNMRLWFDSALPDERPDLVIGQGLVFSAAAELQARGGASVLYWTTSTGWIKSLAHLVGAFAGQIAWEGQWPGVPQPVRDAGHLCHLRMLRSARWLASTSPLTLYDARGSAAQIRSCCTGQWVLDGCQSAQWGADENAFGSRQEHESLEAFLAADGGAPVYLGWGSMPAWALNGGPEGLARLVVKSLRMVDRRGVVVAGWSSLQRKTLQDAIAQEYQGDAEGARRAERRILLLPSSSHEFLFPRCACTVHHGGIGTTHAALRAGVPTIVAPGPMDDQPGNADWVVSLGCGTKAVGLAQLTPDELARALTTVLGDASYQTRAKEVAAVLAAERGVAAAVDVVDECLREPPPLYAAPAPKPPLWLSGFYEFCKGGSLELSACWVASERLCNSEKVPVGQMWAGEFRVEDDGDGIQPGTYTVEAVWGSTLMYGRVRADGRELHWHDGSRHTWKASM